MYCIDENNECFKFYLLKDARKLLIDSELKLDNFKSCNWCCFPLKNNESKITGYITIEKSPQCNNEFKVDYYSETEFASSKFKKQVNTEFFMKQHEREGKQHFELLQVQDGGNNALEIGELSDRKDVGNLISSSAKMLQNNESKVDYYPQTEFAFLIFKNQVNTEFFMKQHEREGKQHFELLQVQDGGNNALHKDDGKEDIEESNGELPKKLNRSINQRSDAASKLEKDITEKTGFDDIKIFLIQNAAKADFISLFWEKIKSYDENQLVALHGQLGRWNRNIKPKLADSYMHIHKNMYKKAQLLMDTNWDNNYKVQFIYGDAFKNELTKQSFDDAHYRLVSV